jgi:hypothetical protein
MLAELAAANAAFAVIKEAIGNGGDLIAAGSKLGEYFGLKNEISKKANRKGSNSEEFWALEKLKKQETQLKEIMIYQGRAGLWADWLKFQAQKKKEREEEARKQRIAAALRKEFIYDLSVTLLITLIGASGIGIIGLMVWYILTKGQ